MNKLISDENETILPEGTTLQSGKYRIDKFLSSGGFGIAYMATNMLFEEKVAIKEFFMKSVNRRDEDSTTISVSTPQNQIVFDEQKEKFMKEAKRLRSFHNKHIVHVVDLFVENGTAYYVMDYIDGESLSSRVEAQGKLPEKEVRNYLVQILDALEEVHNQKMFHLDLKPSNIMVDKGEQVYLIDFGASKQQKADGTGATSNSALAHTPGYAPLEQMSLEYENFGPWTDIYALGASLYNLLTGQKPPSTSKIADLAGDAFEFPSSVSQKMRNLIFWMMKGRRFDRPQSVADVRKFLNKGKKPQKTSYIEETLDSDETILNSFDPRPKSKAKFKSEPEPVCKSKIAPVSKMGGDETILNSATNNDLHEKDKNESIIKSKPQRNTPNRKRVDDMIYEDVSKSNNNIVIDTKPSREVTPRKKSRKEEREEKKRKVRNRLIIKYLIIPLLIILAYILTQGFTVGIVNGAIMAGIYFFFAFSFHSIDPLS